MTAADGATGSPQALWGQKLAVRPTDDLLVWAIAKGADIVLGVADQVGGLETVDHLGAR